MGGFSFLTPDRFCGFRFILDYARVGCMCMLVCCVGVALMYRLHYFEEEVEASLLFPLVLWVLGFMGILFFSRSLAFSLLFGSILSWLGFIILFCFKPSGLRASLLTLLAHRSGDVPVFTMMMCFSWLFGASGLAFAFYTCWRI